MAMLPLAPDRFSTTICRPSLPDTKLPTTRAATSVAPPAGNGTMKWTGRSGHCAAAVLGRAKVAKARSKTIARHSVMAELHSSRPIISGPDHCCLGIAAARHALMEFSLDPGRRREAEVATGNHRIPATVVRQLFGLSLLCARIDFFRCK